MLKKIKATKKCTHKGTQAAVSFEWPEDQWRTARTSFCPELLLLAYAILNQHKLS